MPLRKSYIFLQKWYSLYRRWVQDLKTCEQLVLPYAVDQWWCRLVMILRWQDILMSTKQEIASSTDIIGQAYLRISQHIIALVKFVQEARGKGSQWKRRQSQCHWLGNHFMQKVWDPLSLWEQQCWRRWPVKGFCHGWCVRSKGGGVWWSSSIDIVSQTVAL